jgi:predicted DNA-binding antitoxin AbrB/MazE fold protein
MIIESITAVYKNGILKPQKPLALVENEQVEIQIFRRPAVAKPVLQLSGIFAGQGDFPYEEIQLITRELHQQRMDKLLALFDEPTSAHDQ